MLFIFVIERLVQLLISDATPRLDKHGRNVSGNAATNTESPLSSLMTYHTRPKVVLHSFDRQSLIELQILGYCYSPVLDKIWYSVPKLNNGSTVC